MEKNSGENFQINMVVFAKMKRFPYWPGLICEPPFKVRKSSASSKPGMHWIRFFGSNDYSWVHTHCLKLYAEHKEELSKGAKTVAFRKALKEVEKYISNGCKFSDINDAFDKLMSTSVDTSIQCTSVDTSIPSTSVDTSIQSTSVDTSIPIKKWMEKNSGENFQINMVVFAKMKRFPYWPGLICEPPFKVRKSSASSKPGMHWIRFFGSNDYSWVHTHCLKLYAEHKEELSKGAKTVAFRKALKEVEKYISNGCKFSDINDAFDKLMSTSVDTSIQCTSVDTSIPSTSVDTSIQSTSVDTSIPIKKWMEKNSGENFQINMVVFAKMKRFPYWPGLICEPPFKVRKSSASSKPGMHWIRFFGSNDYSWVHTHCLKLYAEHKEELSKGAKTVAFRKALKEVEKYISNGCKFSDINDAFDKLMSTSVDTSIQCTSVDTSIPSTSVDTSIQSTSVDTSIPIKKWMEKNSGENFQINMVVFAKMKRFPYWPGLICEPPFKVRKSSASSKPGMHWIRFFGSNDYSWVHTHCLKLYAEHKEELSKGAKTVAFRKALKEVEKYISNGCKFSDINDAFDKLMSTSVDTSIQCTSVDTSIPSTSVDTSIQSTSVDTSIPSTSVDTSIQSTSVDTSIPFTSVDTSIPFTSVDSSIPSTSVDTSIPSTSVDTSIPSTSVDTSIPSTSTGIKGIIRTLSNKKGKRNLSGPLSQSSDVSVKENEAENSVETYKKKNFPPIWISPRPESPLNLETIAKEKIEPSIFKLGFIGIGKMGSGLIKNLTVSKHKVMVWNRTKKTDFENMGVTVADTPVDVVRESDITFCCVSDNTAASEVAMGSNGALQEMTTGKAYVEMSGIDPTTSKSIAHAVKVCGGRYLEVRFEGSSAEAEEGSLVLIAAGDRSLYDDCQSAFAAFCKQKTFLGEVGKASTVYLFLQSFLCGVLCAISEVMTMARNFQIPEVEVLDMFEEMSIINPKLIQKCRMALKGNITTQLSLKDLQKDMDMAMEIANKLGVKITELSRTNEHLKLCMREGYKDQDFSTMFLL